MNINHYQRKVIGTGSQLALYNVVSIQLRNTLGERLVQRLKALVKLVRSEKSK